MRRVVVVVPFGLASVGLAQSVLERPEGDFNVLATAPDDCCSMASTAFKLRGWIVSRLSFGQPTSSTGLHSSSPSRSSQLKKARTQDAAVDTPFKFSCRWSQ